MTQPLNIDTILAEFSASDTAWVIIDVVSGARLNVPSPDYPGTDVIRFFLSRDDADRFLSKVIEAAPKLREAVLVAVPVPLIRTATAIAAERKGGAKIGFVVHSPNEVFEAYGN
ncbi:MAG TPA: hypothetical protein VME66_10650 [Candidatus Acidoferrales bacterium]|nr:hypothetical protein [Candidatus Acidoferrales bacterium]